MADLVDKNSALVVKVTGADSSGNETNFIDATVNGVKVDGSAVTQPISASSLPLPIGASTSALQTAGNNSLASIDAGIPTALGQTTMSASMPIVIASDQSRLPVSIADGLGNLLESSTTIPTDSARGLIVRSINEEPATFSVWSIGTALGNNKHMLSVMNGIGSGVIIKLKKIKLINTQTTGVTGVVTDFRGLRITSLTGGTSLTPQSYDTNDTLNGSVAASTGGTVGGLGTTALIRCLYSSDEWGPGTTDVESTDHINQNLFELYNEGFNQKPITIRPGQGFTIQCITNTTAGTFDLEFVFTQET